MIFIFTITDSIKPVPAGSKFIFIINIIKAIRSITSIYIIRSNSDVYISTISGSNTSLGSGFNDIVARKI